MRFSWVRSSFVGVAKAWSRRPVPKTEFGQIAEITGAAGEKTTRLQAQMTKLSRQLGFLGLSVAALILGLGLLGGKPALDMVLTAVSMAVAVVPEGLPLVVTLTLAIGASTMARRKALLRRLQAAETLGAASVICSDKTGTLTENKMTATTIVTADGEFNVTGTGYDPAGRIAKDGQPVRAEDDPDLWRLLHAGLVCNNARLEKAVGWEMIGDPTEGALTTLAFKGWTPIPDPNNRIAETPFTSERKRMGTIALRPTGETALFVKGAPEMVLAVCTHVREGGRDVAIDADRRAALIAKEELMASQGLRVIAIADRAADGPHDTDEADLVLLGLVGLLDPPRPEVANAVQHCLTAGIRVVMITGDSAATARAIAGLVGIPNARVITGSELDTLSEEALADALSEGVLFARTAPVHKMRIIEALQSNDEIIAMTGDGVNDAPALRKANIGVAMGQRGTDVAKEAADLIILDDNFATIVNAIAEGRRQFANIRKFVWYLLSSNSAEMMALTVNLLIGGPIIFLPIHLLWINLLTDSVSAVALGLEPGEKEQMQRPPLRGQ
jgi:Ca2+-transporting ATPase